MAKQRNPTRRAKKRGKSHAFTPPPRAAAKRSRLWVFLVSLAAIVIGLIFVWITESRPDPTASSSGPPSPVTQQHIAEMLESQTRKIPESVLEIQQEELALADAMVQDFPKSDASLAMLASVHQSRGDTTAAEALWKQAVALNPKRSDLYTKLGESAQGKDQIEEALVWWRQGLKANAQAAGLRWLIANALVTQGDLDTAIELLAAEWVITPKAARNAYLTGQIHLKQRAYEKAEEAYRKAIELNPDYYNAYYGLGLVYTRLKQPARAQTAMAQFRELKARAGASEDQQIMIDEVPHARKRIATAYGQAYKLYDPKQQAEIGARLLGRALELNPQDAFLWEKMAGRHYANGQYGQAIRLFQEAEKRAPEKPIYPINIGTLYAQMNQLEEAQAALKRAVSRFPDSSLAHAELAHLYLKSQTHYTEALTLTEKAVALSPTANHYFLLTWAHEVNGDQKSAMAAIQKAIALEPQNPRYRSTYERLRSRL